MNVPLLDLKVQYAAIQGEIRQAMDRVCESQQFILGPEVANLEKEIAALCGARFAVGMSSGTDALLAALMALSVGLGDEVITTPFSFFATAGVVARLNARLVFADIDPKTFNMDSEQAVQKITSRTKVIMPVHLFGRCAEMDPLLEAARDKGIAIVEDAAQAIGAFDERGRSAGTMGAIGCFSFFPSKNLGAFGDGGMVVANDERLAEALRILRAHGSQPKYFHQVVGGNFRLDALQAAVLRVKLKYLKRWTAARRSNADEYCTLFQEAGLLDRIALPADVPGHIYNQFVIRAADRDGLRAFLTERGIGTDVYYPLPLHLQGCFENLGYAKGDFPYAEEAATDCLAIPVYPEMTPTQRQYIVEQVQAFYRCWFIRGRSRRARIGG
jgi:dTDP-4-amino-4,6-dideoxygalactose transaminase